MGYESRLYVVEKSQAYDEELDMCFGEIIAMFDLSKAPIVAENMKACKDTNCYIYADDGNHRIIEDQYGDRLKEISIDGAIEILELAIEKNEHYRRFMPCLFLLKGFKKKEWNNLVVLHYGY